MTPAARYAAAIEVLDDILAGEAAERCLTTWARQNRYAGSKDRAAVRDHVYDVLRAKRSLGALGGGSDGRALVLGLLRRDGPLPETVFGAGGYGPEALSDEEAQAGSDSVEPDAAADIPAWLWPQWQASLGADAGEIAAVQTMRGPTALRVNARRGTREAAQAALAEDDIVTVQAAEVETGLIVTENPRRIGQSRAFLDGLVELQDVASQLAMAQLATLTGGKVLDYCAGGGGKSLALADISDAQVFAHDISTVRMRDIPARMNRAGVDIQRLATQDIEDHGPYDLVLCDAPCSGSGTWRRGPDAKWALNADKLREYNVLQGEILVDAIGFVAPGGTLAYATCSVLNCENGDVVQTFLEQHPDWQQVDQLQLTPTATHDGFFLAVLQRRG